MKNAVVTGGTKGIGLAIVLALLKRGYRVFTNYAHDEKAARVALQAAGALAENLFVSKADQSDKAAMQSFCKHVADHAQQIDCIVCNAGATVRKAAFAITDEDWERVMHITVNAHFYLVRDLSPLLSPAARIVFIGSMMGVLPHGTSLAYGVSKAALHALAKNLVKNFEGTQTTINAIAPGFVETEWQKDKPEEIRQNICRKTALARFASPNEVAQAVLFLIDNPYVNGTVLEVSGGYCFK